MTDEVRYLDLFHLLTLSGSLLGNEPEVRDLGMLESALARPRAAMLGVEAYPSLHLKAAALLDSVVNNHGLVDGNKRAGLVAVFVFYGLNGLDFDAPQDEIFDLIMSVADGSMRDVPSLAHALESWCRPR
ncbi:type II toxin-antitoxin system death-on-curing family toxin [Xylanimonas ulmi]|uniref:Death-on-curing protein n=1 Tax=Xylanimonas ulmi TaxID=228973 RepID=A0A4Q7LZN0_9MICO|nr:type II toxin-antitoxin system death-on-curing family toxin [Xylanibacterium ulmi]RZS60033.1 death-on-curing protein [Xylanibacterium ulmi]